MPRRRPAPAVHACDCTACRSGEKPSTRSEHYQMNLFLSRLDEQQRRWYAALEAKRIGHGGDRYIAQVTGLSVKTIRRGRRELDANLRDGREPARLSCGPHSTTRQRAPAGRGA